MTRQEHLLTIIGEECSEIHKECSKALRFGLEDKEPGQSLTNAQRIIQEFNDLVAVMSMMGEDFLEGAFDLQSLEVKKMKVEKYLLYSAERGTVV